MQSIPFTVHIFREGDAYVAHAPELDVSSCGATETEARRNIRDAVQGFLETSGDMGTLNEVLEESGYRLEEGEWHAPEFVALDHLSVGVG
jgi:predicted RNase H-like HicB family nuclease